MALDLVRYVLFRCLAANASAATSAYSCTLALCQGMFDIRQKGLRRWFVKMLIPHGVDADNASPGVADLRVSWLDSLYEPVLLEGDESKVIGARTYREMMFVTIVFMQPPWMLQWNSSKFQLPSCWEWATLPKPKYHASST